MMNLDGPALIVAQNTFARRIALDAKGHWNIKDQYNSGRNSAVRSRAPPPSTPTATAPRRSCCSIAPPSRSCSSRRRTACIRPSGSLLVGTINFQGLHVADFDGDGRDDLLIAGTDRFGVLQTGRKGQRLKTIASYESKRNEARLSDLAAGDVNADGVPDVVFSDIGEQSLEIATYAGDPELVPAITFKIFERKTFRNVGDIDRTARHGHRRRGRRRPRPTSSSSSTTACWSIARTPGLARAKPGEKPVASGRTSRDGRGQPGLPPS